MPQLLVPVSSRWLVSLLVFVFAALARAAAPQGGEPAPSIVLVGDSTVTDSSGWGLGFRQYLDARVKLDNTAMGGRSSQSFMSEGRWNRALGLKADYYLLQFGHNNEPGKPGRSTDMATYVANMEQYVDEARAAGATPILVTPLTRRQWDKERPGRIKSSLAPYAEQVRALAQRKQVALVDLHARSIELCEALGAERCLEFSPVKKQEPQSGAKPAHDGTHLSGRGRVLFAGLVVEELRRAVPALAPYLRQLPADENPSAPEANYDAVVSADGSGTHTDLQAAINAAPDNSANPFFILLKPGVYRGQIMVPAGKRYLRLVGEELHNTVITYDLNVKEPEAGVQDKYKGIGVVILGDDFSAEKITFQNTAGDRGQALALRIEADRVRLENCRLLGWQDTLRLEKGRSYLRNCHIEGRVDFIYGSGTSVLENCTLLSKNGGYLTAASTPQDKPFGFVFLRCSLVGDDTPWSPAGSAPPTTKARPLAYLGRPWRPHAAVAFLYCTLGDHLRPEGWHNWGKVENEATARYLEFENRGPGAATAARVPWSRQLSAEEAASYTVENILGGDDGWRP